MSRPDKASSPSEGKPPRERELKYRLLEREDYERLVRADDLGRRSPARRQENYYFDTADLRLLKAGAMLRLRREETLRLTFKQGGESQAMEGYFDAVEVECETAPEWLDQVLERPDRLLESPLPPAKEVRERFGRPPLDLVGRLTNQRVQVAARYLLEVDHLSYPDGSESFEVEIETPDPEGARRWLEETLAARGIRAEPQRLTKLETLMRRFGRRWE